MATDTTHVPQGELNTDAGSDMAGSELEFGAVQLAQVTTDGGQPVQLPRGQQVLLIPIQPGQTVTLPTDSVAGLAARIGPEGNLAIVVDGRTIILQGYVAANEQSPVLIRTNDGDEVIPADVIAATDPTLDIQTAAGPATGDTGDGTDSSGIYTPFNAGPGLAGLNAIGVLQATELSYRLINNEFKIFVRDEEDPSVSDIEITFDLLGGIVNEDDLPADARREEQVAFKLVVKDQGNNGTGNDPFDTTDRENQPGDADNIDDNGSGVDPDPEPLTAQAFVKVNFGLDVPGTLWVDETKLPTGLTSEGEPIIYQVLPPSGAEGNGIVGFVDYGGVAGEYDEGTDRLVFEIKVNEKSSNSEFTIDFTLHDNIDNEVPDQNEDGRADLLGGVEQILGLPVQLTAKDSNGTPLTAVMDLGVEDDIPFFGEVVINEGEGGIEISIENRDAGIEHDESKGVQDSSDDQSYSDAKGWVQPATQKVIDAGFGLPYGDSEGALWPKGIAQTQVIASFGADQATQEHWKEADDASARNSIFGELEDRTDADGDGLDDGENERPFELFMTTAGTGGTPSEDDLGTAPVEGNLTIEDQLTNATVTWDGGDVLPVWLHQVDAQTIIGYVIPEGSTPEEALRAALEVVEADNGEAVFVLTIDDNGVMTFVQYHQLNHPDFPDNHDEEFEIADINGDPLIHVRISDYDGDHAQQPVHLVVEDDGPKFKDVCFTHGNGTVDEDFLGKLLSPGNFDVDNLVGGGKGDDQILDGTWTSGTIKFSIGVDKPGALSIGSLVITDSNNQVVSLASLKTADGHGITLQESGPDGNGVITLTGVEDGSGDPVFTMKLDTSGGDMGDFKFTLHQALQHPYTDSDFVNDDNPDSAFEDNFNFAFNVVATDIDKDTAQGTINIKVDDDSPTALDDYDVVKEGKTGDAWNFASGNVVTGKDAVLLGKDSNGFPLDGIPDLPGADRPYTISKLSHDGTTYELSADGLSVSNLGAGDSYDSATGILKITTEEGGTFEIVMISSTQSQVGEYRYTVPADADHDKDFHIGPADIAATLGTGFDSVGEWVSAFNTGGITLEGFRGGAAENLDIKQVNVPSGPSYRGIGVDKGIDGVEVDLNGPEYLKLTIQDDNFPGGVNNAQLLLGAFFDGVKFDAGNQEILKWEIWNDGVLVNSGEIVGDLDGLVTLDIDSPSKFDEIRLYPLDNGAGNNGNNSDFLLLNVEICCPKDKFTEKFDYTLRDSDGDEDTASICIDVKDTEPKFRREGDAIVPVLVDEDGITNGLKDSSSQDDVESTSDGNVDNDGIHKGKINFTPGADPVTIELTVGNGGDTGLVTSDGEKKVLAAWDAATSTLIGYIEGTDPADAGNRVFTATINNHQTGEFTFTLLKAVEHPDSDQTGDNNENDPNLSFVIDFQIEDKDCDTIFGQMVVKIDDDMPSVDLIAITVDPDGDGKLVHDESAGVQNNGDGSGDADPQASGEDEDDVVGPLAAFSTLESSETLAALGYAATVINVDLSGGTANPNAAFGADGPGESVLKLTKSDGGDFTGDQTNLTDTASGEPIFLYTEFFSGEPIVVGRVGSAGVADADGDVAFALSLNGDTGAFELAQYRVIDQLDPSAADESITLLAGGTDVPTGLVYATVEITDRDGDTVSKSISLDGLNGNPSIVFQDDFVAKDLQPEAFDDKVCVAEPVANANVMLIFDVSGSMNADSGVNDPNGPGTLTKLGAAKLAAKNMLTAYEGLGGDIRVMLVWFNSGGNREAAWLSVPQALAAIDAIPASSNGALTSYQDAITTAISGFNDTDGRGDPATHPGLVYLLSDGQPTVDGNPNDNPDADGLPNFGITPATLDSWNNLLENDNNNVDHVYAVGFGAGIPGGVNNVHLNAVANPDSDAPADPQGTVLFVDNLADLEATLLDTIGSQVTGNVLDGTIEDDVDAPALNTPDNVGDAPAHVSSLAYNGGVDANDISATWDGVGPLIIAGGSNLSVVGTAISFDTDHGRMTFDLATGDFKFAPNAISGGDKHELFQYQITDVDGDVSNVATLDVCIQNAPPTIRISDVAVDEGGIANVVVTLSEPAPAGGLTLSYVFGGGTAALGSDYDGSALGATVTIPEGATTANIQVNAKSDAFFDDNETYNVVISGAPAGWNIIDDTGVVTINDTTTITAPVVSFATQSPSGFLTSGETSNNSNPWTGSNSTSSGNRDNVDLGNGDDVGNAQAGHDHVEGGNGNDTLNGGDGNDYLEGDADNDTLNGGNNNDLLQGEDGNDTLHGDAGNDLLEGGNGNDILFGDADDDEVSGGNNNDDLHGGSGNDYLHGDSGLDKYFGDEGDDWIEVDSTDLGASRQIEGGSGNDVLDISGSDFDGSLGGISGIEVISMEGGGNNDDVTLSPADVLSISGGTLFIWGDSSGGADDEVQLSNADGWSQVANNLSSNGRTYDIFQSGGATLAVDTDVDVVFS